MLHRYDKILDTPLHPEAAAAAAAAAEQAEDDYHEEEAEQLPVVPEYPLEHPEYPGTRGAARQRPVRGGGREVHASVVRLRRQREDRAELDAEAARRAARGGGGAGSSSSHSSMYEAYSSFEIEADSEPGMADAQQLDPGFEQRLRAREASGWAPPRRPGSSTAARGGGGKVAGGQHRGGGGDSGGRGRGGATAAGHGRGDAAARANRLTHEGLLAKAEAKSLGRSFLFEGGARGESSGRRRSGRGQGHDEGRPLHNERRPRRASSSPVGAQWRQRDSGDQRRRGR